MPLFGKKSFKKDPEVEFAFTEIGEESTVEADVQAVMEKYDRESNVRI